MTTPIWQPWVTYKEELPVLNISAPPCSTCKFWKPQRTYIKVGEYGQMFDGVKLCHAGEMFSDFSCFRSK